MILAFTRISLCLVLCTLDVAASPWASWNPIKSNLFLHRNRRTQSIDEVWPNLIRMLFWLFMNNFFVKWFAIKMTTLLIEYCLFPNNSNYCCLWSIKACFPVVLSILMRITIWLILSCSAQLGVTITDLHEIWTFAVFCRAIIKICPIWLSQFLIAVLSSYLVTWAPSLGNGKSATLLHLV